MQQRLVMICWRCIRGITNDVLHRVPAQCQCAARVSKNVRAHILRIRTSTASYIIPPDVVACRTACRRSTRMSTSLARICAQAGTRYWTRVARGAIPEHTSHVLCSALGKIGQASQLGIVRRGRHRGRSGALGAGRWFCPGTRGAGRLSAPPSAPANPAGRRATLIHGRRRATTPLSPGSEPLAPAQRGRWCIFAKIYRHWKSWNLFTKHCFSQRNQWSVL